MNLIINTSDIRGSLHGDVQPQISRSIKTMTAEVNNVDRAGKPVILVFTGMSLDTKQHKHRERESKPRLAPLPPRTMDVFRATEPGQEPSEG